MSRCSVKIGKKIAVQSETSDLAAMEKNNGKDGNNYKLVAYANAVLAAEAVVKGQAEAALMNHPRAAAAIETLAVKFLGYAKVPEEYYAYGVNKDSVELLATLNAGLEELMADPYWIELKKKYRLDASFE
ncbi:MAG: transporter substrate-binding domain-containing protein [Deltaproteobacteria bacterium]|jgi:polar amino acid transport system substrate-binding protein|nr:transporter substrate-binding domain-containing protein [Deltaproteobacteria bacterium]